MLISKEEYEKVPKEVLKAVNCFEHNPIFPFYIEPDEYFVNDAFKYMTELYKKVQNNDCRNS